MKLPRDSGGGMDGGTAISPDFSKGRKKITKTRDEEKKSLNNVAKENNQMKIVSDRHLEKSASLNAIRWFPYASFTFLYITS